MLLDGNELEVVMIEIQDAGRGAVGERNRHPAFAGRQAVVADRRLAVQLGELRQKHADRSAGPHRQHRELRPGMFGQQRAVLLSKLLQLARPLRRAPAIRPRKRRRELPPAMSHESVPSWISRISDSLC